MNILMVENASKHYWIVFIHVAFVSPGQISGTHNNISQICQFKDFIWVLNFAKCQGTLLIGSA